MPQARAFDFGDEIWEVLAEALLRFNTGTNGDDSRASNPTTPTALLINWRRVKRLSLRRTQISPFSHETKPAFLTTEQLQT